MSFTHKEGCSFNNFDTHLMNRDPNGADSLLMISEQGITFDYNECTYGDKEDFDVVFNYCPICGVKKDED